MTRRSHRAAEAERTSQGYTEDRKRTGTGRRSEGWSRGRVLRGRRCNEWEEAGARSGRASPAWLRGRGLIPSVMGSVTGEWSYLMYLCKWSPSCLVENGWRLWRPRQEDHPRGDRSALGYCGSGEDGEPWTEPEASRPGCLNLGTVDIWAGECFAGGAVLCTVGCFTASLTSTH